MSASTPTGVPLTAPAADDPVSEPAALIPPPTSTAGGPSPASEATPGLVALGDPDAAVCTDGVCHL